MPPIVKGENCRHAPRGAGAVRGGVLSLAEHFHAQRQIAYHLPLQSDGVTGEVLIAQPWIVGVAASAKRRPGTKGLLQPDRKEFRDGCAAIGGPDRNKDLREEGHLWAPALIVFLDKTIFDATAQRRPHHPDPARPRIDIKRNGPAKLRVLKSPVIELDACFRRITLTGNM